jgi:hypothetical protein
LIQSLHTPAGMWSFIKRSLESGRPLTFQFDLWVELIPRQNLSSRTKTFSKTRRLIFACQRFGTIYLFHLQRLHTHNNLTGPDHFSCTSPTIPAHPLWTDPTHCSLSPLVPLRPVHLVPGINTGPHFQSSPHFVSSLWRWDRYMVPKRRHAKIRRRGYTQKTTHNIQNTAKVWNQEFSKTFSWLANMHFIEIFMKTMLVPHSKPWKVAQADNFRDDIYNSLSTQIFQKRS